MMLTSDQLLNTWAVARDTSKQSGNLDGVANIAGLLAVQARVQRDCHDTLAAATARVAELEALMPNLSAVVSGVEITLVGAHKRAPEAEGGYSYDEVSSFEGKTIQEALRNMVAALSGDLGEGN